MRGPSTITREEPAGCGHHADASRTTWIRRGQHPHELITYGGNGAVFRTGPNTASPCATSRNDR